MVAYCRGGYLVRGMRPRGLLVAAYCGEYIYCRVYDPEGCWWLHIIGEDT